MARESGSTSSICSASNACIFLSQFTQKPCSCGSLKHSRFLPCAMAAATGRSPIPQAAHHTLTSTPPDVTVPAPAPQPTGLSFTQGFLLGQLSVTLLIFFFIKFFIFGEPPPADERHATRATERRERTLAHQRTLSPAAVGGSVPPASSTLLRHKRSTILRPPPPVTSATILAKTYYNVKGHQPESLDWFNVLIAQTIAQLRADARQDDAVLTSLTNILNGPTRPDWLGEIRVTEIELGDEFPIFSNCRVIPVEDGGLGLGSPNKSDGGASNEGRLQARMDVDLSDVITLGIETTLMLNWPRPRVAVLPVALAVSVVRFSGTVSFANFLRIQLFDCSVLILFIAISFLHPVRTTGKRRSQFTQRELRFFGPYPYHPRFHLPGRLPPRSLSPLSPWQPFAPSRRSKDCSTHREPPTRMVR